jgi:hypothetical protein
VFSNADETSERRHPAQKGLRGHLPDDRRRPPRATLVRAPGVWEPGFQNPGIVPGVIVSPRRGKSGTRGFEAKFRQSMKPHEVFMDRDEYGPNSPKAWDCGWGDSKLS